MSTGQTCRYGHTRSRANVYVRPSGSRECWVCILHERWRYWAARGRPYQPGPGARAKIEQLRTEGVWVAPPPFPRAPDDAGA